MVIACGWQGMRMAGGATGYEGVRGREGCTSRGNNSTGGSRADSLVLIRLLQPLSGTHGEDVRVRGRKERHVAAVGGVVAGVEACHTCGGREREREGDEYVFKICRYLDMYVGKKVRG